MWYGGINMGYGSGYHNGMISLNGNARLIPVIIVLLLLLGSIVVLPGREAAEVSITVFRPNGGQEWVAGSTERVQWSISSTGGYVRVSLSTDGGSTYELLRVMENHPSHGFGWFDWTIPPNINSTGCRIKVEWVDDLIRPYNILDTDESDANFTILRGVSLTITDIPDLVSYARYYYCKWDLYDPYDMVAGLIIDWRTDDGSGWTSWHSLSTYYDWYDPNMGYLWWTPPYIQSGSGQIRIRAMSEGNASTLDEDQSDIFSIVSPGTTLLQPDGGVTLVAGTTYTIKWRTSEDPEKTIMGINIRYSTNGGSTWYTIASSIPNSFEYDWTVPSISTSNLIVNVSSQWGEWYYLAGDQSSAPNTIITDPNIPTVTLLDPNPPVDGGVVMGSGEIYPVRYSVTGASNIDSIQISYSINNGSTYTPITTVTSGFGSTYLWTVPSVDSWGGRIRLVMSSSSHPDKVVSSVHSFYIYDTIEFNRPPVAICGPDIEANEGETIYLDGTGSYDPDGDFIQYSWTQVSPTHPVVDLYNTNYATPFFTVELTHYPVTFVFELEVSDGIDHSDAPILYNVDRMAVTVSPSPPELLTFGPEYAWIGVPITITGNILMGAEVLMGSEVVTTVPTSPVAGNPDPDHSYTFTLYSDLPSGTYSIGVRNMMGGDSSSAEMEIFPVPEWQYDNGIGFHNNHTHTLSYPWNPWGEGRYKDVFGDQVYLTAWICIGLPYWTPWGGWGCLGYEIEEPFAPDPLAAIYYGAVFHHIARSGECFGMSSTALKYFHGDVSMSHFHQSGASEWRDLERSGEMKRYIQEHQGAQMSAEILNAYLDTLLNGLIPSSSITGMGPLIDTVKHYIDTGEMGILTMIADGGAHAVVPYAYEDTGDKVRFYVYDSNRDAFSDPEDAISMALGADPWNAHPPYVEIERSGIYWEWSFDWPDGSVWSSAVGMGFVPYHVVSGRRTMPLSIEGIFNLLAGSAESVIEDEGGNEIGVAEDGSLIWGMDGAAPLPIFEGAGYKPQSFFLPTGNYTTHVRGTDNGHYNWSSINNGSSAYSIDDAEIKDDSNDTLAITYENGNPYLGKLTFSTGDDVKHYNASISHEYEHGVRMFRVIGAELNDDGEHGSGSHSISTTEDYRGIVFENKGGGPTTFSVEFSGSVICEKVWNGSGRPRPPELPTARRDNITVGPGETLIVYPTNWVDLNGSVVVIEGETSPGPVLNLEAMEEGGRAHISWDEPADDGGWPILEYNVFRGSSPDNLTLIGTVSERSFTDDSVERGATYYYSVRAMNVLGEGRMAPAVELTIPDLTAPSAPRNMTLRLNGTAVVIRWEPPADDGGSGITGYVVLRGMSQNDLSDIAETGTVLSYTDSGLAYNTTYYYAVVAVNDMGRSALSEIVSVHVPEEQVEPPPPVGDGEEGNGTPWLLFIMIAVVVLVLLVLLFVYLSRTGEEGEPAPPLEDGEGPPPPGEEDTEEDEGPGPPEEEEPEEEGMEEEIGEGPGEEEEGMEEEEGPAPPDEEELREEMGEEEKEPEEESPKEDTGEGEIES